MINCIICSAESELHEAQFGYYTNGWIGMQVSFISQGIINWRKLHLCDKCVPHLSIIMDKINGKS